MSEAQVDNGVNVEALLAAREEERPGHLPDQSSGPLQTRPGKLREFPDEDLRHRVPDQREGDPQ